MLELKVKITTQSNCLIGNQTESFSVGGVDQSTTLDEDRKPVIHGSAVKGSLRNIVRENEVEMQKTQEYVKRVLEDMLRRYNEILGDNRALGKDKLTKIIHNIEKYIAKPKAEYIFGIENLNNMPRVFCTDFRVVEDPNDKNQSDNSKYLTIETKNSLEEKDNEIISRPRTYRVVKPGVTFEGWIRFQDTYFNGDNKELETIKEELKKQLEKFNEGFYGIGNSKSRGFGNIQVECE